MRGANKLETLRETGGLLRSDSSAQQYRVQYKRIPILMVEANLEDKIQ